MNPPETAGAPGPPQAGRAASSAPGPGSAATSAVMLRAELEEDIRRIEGENGEIDMLMEQVLVEIERHAARRAKLEAELATLEADTTPDHDAIEEMRANLLTLTRKELLFDAQRQVLEGKQRVLARFLQRLVEIDNSLAAMGGVTVRPAPTASPGLRPLANAGGGRTTVGGRSAIAILRSQEDLRRDIVRQLHDGPAQSIANIGMQAEIVERLVGKGDARASEEVAALRRLVQQALDATKEFIFEIRPMVLDDLGLAPTLRRVTSDRARRSGISVDFASQGIEERLDPDIESAVYRSLEEAIAGYLALQPPSVIVRLDWSDRELVATVAGTWPRVDADGTTTPSATGDTRSNETPPALLAMMEENRSQDREARTAARSLPTDLVAEIEERARALGLESTSRDDGQTLELVVPIARRP